MSLAELAFYLWLIFGIDFFKRFFQNSAMTATEKKYMKCLGSLYTYNWLNFWRYGKDVDMIVMPVEMKNLSGWWHYRLQIIGDYPNVTEYQKTNMIVVCKDFLRKAKEIKDAA